MLRDRLWFFVGYIPQISEQTRTVTFTQNGQTQSFDSPTRDHNLNWNVTGQATRSVRFRVNGINETEQDDVEPPVEGAEPYEHGQPGAFPEPAADGPLQQPVQRRRGLGRVTEDCM